MKPDEFAQMIRRKYPNGIASDGTPYAEIDDKELTRRVIEKHPIYKSKVEIDDGLIGSPVNAVKEFISGVGGSLKERGGKIGEELTAIEKGEKSPYSPRASLRIAGQAGGFVGDVSFEALKLIAPKFVEDMVSEGAEAVGNTQAAQKFAEKYAELKDKHPEAMQDIEDVLNIAELIPIFKGGSLALKGGKGTVSKVSRITGEVLDAQRASRIARATEEIDSVVGKIVQGKKGDISKARKALSSIDTTDVKTYADLKTKINDGVEALAGKVDEQLETAGQKVGPLKPNDLTVSTKVGKTTVKQKFVDDALNQLDELYTKIKDSPNKARIGELKNKLNREGLTLKELNDLAREYGSEFGKKGFSKVSGDPLTSVNAQAFENTRKGVKNVVRGKMPDDLTKMLDQRMSEMLNTNRLVAKMEEKVNTLYQRAKKRGILEKIARSTADAVNAATFNTLSGFVSRLLPSNVGLKVMNSIDLEDALNKNLKRLDRLLKTTDDKLLEDEIVKLVKKNVDDAGLESAAGVVAGLETYEDEEGNIRVRFDPAKALLGFGATALGTKAIKRGKQEIVLKNIDPAARRLLKHPEGEGVVNTLKRAWDKFLSKDYVSDYDPTDDIAGVWQEVFKRNKLPTTAKGAINTNSMIDDLIRLRDDLLIDLKRAIIKSQDRSTRGDLGRFTGSKTKAKDFDFSRISPQ